MLGFVDDSGVSHKYGISEQPESRKPKSSDLAQVTIISWLVLVGYVKTTNSYSAGLYFYRRLEIYQERTGRHPRNLRVLTSASTSPCLVSPLKRCGCAKNRGLLGKSTEMHTSGKRWEGQRVGRLQDVDESKE